jgi:pSer/pThr/pTyr-binding forkhead associated (FHA) protein
MSESSTGGNAVKRIGRLSLKKSDGTYRDFTIKRSILIGRGKECDIRIKVKTVSRRHCQVLVTNGEYFLENIGTTNFTSVNHQEVYKPLKLENGDIITVAERDFLFQLVDADDVSANMGVNSEDTPGLYAVWCGAPIGDDDEDGENKGGCVIA